MAVMPPERILVLAKSRELRAIAPHSGKGEQAQKEPPAPEDAGGSWRRSEHPLLDLDQHVHPVDRIAVGEGAHADGELRARRRARHLQAVDVLRSGVAPAR